MIPNAALEALRAQAPLVHCITNYVAMNIAANVTLAAGASPAMIHAPEEVADFAPIAGALTINIGTLSTQWVDSMKAAAVAANSANVPWVLDPVAHFATAYRAKVAKDLLTLQPTILRGNASEIIALAGGAGSGKGADSGDSVNDAQSAAEVWACRFYHRRRAQRQRHRRFRPYAEGDSFGMLFNSAAGSLCRCSTEP